MFDERTALFDEMISTEFPKVHKHDTRATVERWIVVREPGLGILADTSLDAGKIRGPDKRNRIVAKIPQATYVVHP